MKTTDLLESVKQQTLAIIATTEKEFLPLSADYLNNKPSQTAWSIAECLEHLNYYSDYYNKNIRLAIDQAKHKKWKATETFESSWLGKKSIESVHPNNQKAQKTLSKLNPSKSKVAPDVVARFLKHQTTFLTLLNEAQNVNLKKAKVRIEVMKLLQLRLGDIFLFMVAHNQRHCNQALRLLPTASKTN